MIVEVKLSDLSTDNYIELERYMASRRLKDEIPCKDKIEAGPRRLPTSKRRQNRQGKRLAGQQIIFYRGMSSSNR